MSVSNNNVQLINHFDDLYYDHINDDPFLSLSVALLNWTIEPYIYGYTPENINNIDDSGNSPLNRAIGALYRCQTDYDLMNLMDKIIFLINNGADPNLKNHLHETPLFNLIGFYIMGYGYADYDFDPTFIMIKIFLNHGANPNISVLSCGLSQISYLIDKYHTSNVTQIIELLLIYGANPNTVYDEYNPGYDDEYDYRYNVEYKNSTILHILVQTKNGGCERTKRIQLLLDHGANPNFQNKDGKSPLDLAILHENKNAMILFHNYNRNIFRLLCKGLKPYKIGINALLLIGQQMKILPDNDLIDIIMNCLC